MVAAAIAVAAIFTGATAPPAQADTHFCQEAFTDPTLSAACALALQVVCVTNPPLAICL
jgi:hypothetical protein